MVLALLLRKGAPSFGRVYALQRSVYLLKVLRLRGPVAEILASGGGPCFAAFFWWPTFVPVNWQQSQSLGT